MEELDRHSVALTQNLEHFDIYRRRRHRNETKQNDVGERYIIYIIYIYIFILIYIPWPSRPGEFPGSIEIHGVFRENPVYLIFRCFPTHHFAFPIRQVPAQVELRPHLDEMSGAQLHRSEVSPKKTHQCFRKGIRWLIEKCLNSVYLINAPERE